MGRILLFRNWRKRGEQSPDLPPVPTAFPPWFVAVLVVVGVTAAMVTWTVIDTVWRLLERI